MNKLMRILILLVVVVAVAGVVVLKKGDTQKAAVTKAPADAATPRLIEFGSTTCVPCKAMKPILDELERDYAGQLSIEFVDIHKDPDTMAKFDISIIPTQVFVASDGKELFRHEGFYPKDEILAKWKELGYAL